MFRNNRWLVAVGLLLVIAIIVVACAPAPAPAPASSSAAPAPTSAPASSSAAPASSSAAPAPTSAPASSSAASAAANKVEVFSWWVGPGEADGLAAMIKIFQAKYPNDTFVNASVAGGAGTNAKAVLATRLQGGTPPDSWQAHAGEATFAYVDAKQVQPLDDFFKSSGFGAALPASLLPLISKDGHPYSVPVNIHRSNVMWYNPKVLKAAGVTLPAGGFANYDDFFAACDKIKAAGKTCLALGPAWTAEHLFENVMIGSLGSDGWAGLWTGKTDWASADVTKALNNYAKALTYTNKDAATLSDWQPAAQLMTNGDAAFNIMGDWAYGYFANPAPNGLALKPHTDFDWAPPPGTNGVFVFLADSFVLPVGNKSPQGTKDWLTVAASKEGQEAFNPLKGSICARTDCDQSKFSEYSQNAAKDWASNKVVGSLTHEVVGNPSWNDKVATALGVFVADPTKVTAFQTALVAAYKSDSRLPAVAPASSSAAANKVEVFSWWVGPGEADGLAAMIKIFQAKYPNDTFVNASVAGGAGTNAKAVLATRLQGGTPPDSWQAHAGEATFAYVDAKQVQPLDDFFKSSGFGAALPASLLPLISKDGHPYSVPVNIHRSNVMWYNPKVLKAAGVTLPAGGFANYDDFFAACDKIKAAGKTCLALGPAWTAEHLFENVMIGSLGSDGWAGLWTGKTDWASADVTKALNNYAKALTYTNKDAATLSDWQPAAQLMTNGDAAFNIMGDWAYGYFANPAPNGLALKPHTDFDWAPPPGTNGVFVFLADSFVLPVGNKSPQGTKDWLTVAASKEGQEAFNPLKGSICARTDCDQSKFSEYSQNAAKDWASNKVVGSLTHEVVGNPSWNDKVATALGVFVADPTKVTAFQTALVAACKSDGGCK